MTTGIRFSKAAEDFKEAAFNARAAKQALAGARTRWEAARARGASPDEMRGLETHGEVLAVRVDVAHKLEDETWQAYVLETTGHG